MHADDVGTCGVGGNHLPDIYRVRYVPNTGWVVPEDLTRYSYSSAQRGSKRRRTGGASRGGNGHGLANPFFAGDGGDETDDDDYYDLGDDEGHGEGVSTGVAHLMADDFADSFPPWTKDDGDGYDWTNTHIHTRHCYPLSPSALSV